MAGESKRIPLPWSRSCFVCGEANPRGLNARSWIVGDRIELPFDAPSDLVGWNEVLHGGIIATVLDEVMTWSAIVASERPCFAAEFSVRLRTPLPPERSCLAVASTARHRRRVLDTEAELQGEDGTVYATATGRYMAMPRQHASAARHDFVTAEGCWPLEKILEDEPEAGADD